MWMWRAYRKITGVVGSRETVNCIRVPVGGHNPPDAVVCPEAVPEAAVGPGVAGGSVRLQEGAWQQAR